MLSLRRSGSVLFGAATSITTLYLLDKTINDDLDDVSDLFRRKLSAEETDKRPHVVILGTGWAAMSALKKVHKDKYRVTVISPRNFFLFTPMLAGSTTGLVEHRSIVEPIRSFAGSSSGSIMYVQAECEGVDVANNTLICKDVGNVNNTFEVKYDQLIMAVGCGVATFGIKGVQENALFMKEIEDSKRIRDRIQNCFEAAALPGKKDKDIEQLLHFVVVGGGPSGVEFCGELNDFITTDLASSFPQLKGKVKVTLVEALPNILASFDKGLVKYAENSLSSEGVEVRTRTAVTSVDKEELVVKDMTNGNTSVVPYGALVWVAGIATRPITRALMANIGEKYQSDRRGLLVDGHMRVKGTKNVWAVGDCAFSGLPPTAQVAAQEGAFLGRMFNEVAEAMHSRDPTEIDNALDAVEYFNYRHYGSFAYIGGSRALAEVKPSSEGSETVKVQGESAFWMWRGLYMTKLFSLRNKTLVTFDWVKARVFGRDTSRADRS